MGIDHNNQESDTFANNPHATLVSLVQIIYLIFSFYEFNGVKKKLIFGWYYIFFDRDYYIFITSINASDVLKLVWY